MGLEVWRDRLTRLLEDYVRRFPEQCPYMVLAQRWTRSAEQPMDEAPRW